MVLHPNVLYPPQTLYTLGPPDAAQIVLQQSGSFFHSRSDLAQNFLQPGHIAQYCSQREELRFRGGLRRAQL